MTIIKPTRIEPVFIGEKLAFTVHWDTYLEQLTERVNNSSRILDYTTKYRFLVTSITLVLEDAFTLMRAGRPFEIDLTSVVGWEDNTRIAFRVDSANPGLEVLPKTFVTIVGNTTFPAFGTGYLELQKIGATDEWIVVSRYED